MRNGGTRKTRTEVVVKPKELPDDRHAEVARRAYELFERRGGQLGHEIEDWLEAERSLGQESTRPA